MFGNLRVNNQIYVFHKDNTPYLEVGNVISVTAPMPNLAAIGQPTMYTVDVIARVGDQSITYQKLPANLDVADFAGNGNVVIASTRSAMNAELEAMRQRSIDVIKSVDYHNGIVQTCDKILQDLNPEQAEQAAQQAEIKALKQQMSQMSQGMQELMQMNKDLMEQLRNDRASGKVSKPNKE